MPDRERRKKRRVRKSKEEIHNAMLLRLQECLSEADKLILDKSKERLCFMFVWGVFVTHYVKLFQLAKHVESALPTTVFAKPCLFCPGRILIFFSMLLIH